MKRQSEAISARHALRRAQNAGMRHANRDRGAFAGFRFNDESGPVHAGKRARQRQAEASAFRRIDVAVLADLAEGLERDRNILLDRKSVV